MGNIFRPPCDEAVLLSATAGSVSHSAGPWILTATILGSSMAFIDGTVVNVAIPALQKALNATVVDAQWVVECYALFLSALLLVGGSLGDRFGRRLIYAIGVGVFALSSACCGASRDVSQLIFGRAIQGIGGALLVPGSLAIISSSFGEERRGQAIGTWSGFTAITAAIGPVIGGWLVEHISWRAAFYINVPLAAVVLVLLFWRVPESCDKQRNSKLDWRGATLVTAGLGGLVFGLIESSRLGFAHPLVVSFLASGIVLIVAFLFMEARASDPMLPLNLFRSHNFRGANLLTLFLYAALAGALFFFPLNLIQVQGYTATAAGAAFLPFILILFALSRWSGGLIQRYGSRLPLVIGPLLAATGFTLFALPKISRNYWTSFFPAIVVLGFGMAVSVAPLTTTVMNSVDSKRAGIASGINNAVSRTAGLLAVAVFGIVMFRTFSVRLDDRMASLKVASDARETLSKERDKLGGIQLPATLDSETQNGLSDAIKDSFVFGFRIIMLTSAALAVLSSISALLMIEGKRHDELKNRTG